MPQPIHYNFQVISFLFIWLPYACVSVLEITGKVGWAAKKVDVLT